MYRFRMPTDIRQIDKITEELCEKRDIANPAREGVSIGPQKCENSAKSGMVGIPANPEPIYQNYLMENVPTE